MMKHRRMHIEHHVVAGGESPSKSQHVSARDGIGGRACQIGKRPNCAISAGQGVEQRVHRGGRIALARASATICSTGTALAGHDRRRRPPAEPQPTACRRPALRDLLRPSSMPVLDRWPPAHRSTERRPWPSCHRCRDPIPPKPSCGSRSRPEPCHWPLPAIRSSLPSCCRRPRSRRLPRTDDLRRFPPPHFRACHCHGAARRQPAIPRVRMPQPRPPGSAYCC